MQRAREAFWQLKFTLLGEVGILKFKGEWKTKETVFETTENKDLKRFGYIFLKDGKTCPQKFSAGTLRGKIHALDQHHNMGYQGNNSVT